MSDLSKMPIPTAYIDEASNLDLDALKRLEIISDHILTRHTPKSDNNLFKFMMHEMTCGNLDHGHGTIRIRWDKSDDKETSSLTS